MTLICERCIDHEQDMYVCLVDYEKAFNVVNRVKLLEVLKSIGVDWRDRRLIDHERLYKGQSVRVRLKKSLIRPSRDWPGYQKGCWLSPILFNIYFESIHYNWEVISLRQSALQMIKQP